MKEELHVSYMNIFKTRISETFLIKRVDDDSFNVKNITSYLHIFMSFRACSF